MQDALAGEVSLLLVQVTEDANSTWVPCSNATVTIEGCLQSVAGVCACDRLRPWLWHLTSPWGTLWAWQVLVHGSPHKLARPPPVPPVTGTNYWLRLNVSCPDYAFPDTLQLEATIYDPLDNTTRPTVGGRLSGPTVRWMTLRIESWPAGLRPHRLATASAGLCS